MRSTKNNSSSKKTTASCAQTSCAKTKSKTDAKSVKGCK